MTLTLELFLFFVFAVVAVLAAVMMLTSRNAVHAALWLVLNFICVAMFYLMLSAPFLAMIQITVYAGAIMVLFMFVIMLLGAEKLSITGGRYGWLPTAAILLSTVLMVLAGLAITAGGVNTLKPTPRNPQIRVVHAAKGVPAVDVYLNDTKTLSTVGFEGSTDFGRVPPGEYELKVLPGCEADPCPALTTESITPIVQTVINLAPETATTYVITGEGDHAQLIAVPTDLVERGKLKDESGNIIKEDENTFRFKVLNALPGATVSLVRIDPADRTKTEPLVTDLVPGAASNVLVITQGEYDLAWVQGNQRLAVIPDYQVKNGNTELLVLTGEANPTTGAISYQTLHVNPVRINAGFGSPQQMGLEMLSTYLLPFELVSLLLLAAMVGAIILTREDVVRRVRQRVKVSGTAAQINRAMQQSGAAGSSSSAGSAESSAD